MIVRGAPSAVLALLVILPALVPGGAGEGASSVASATALAVDHIREHVDDSLIGSPLGWATSGVAAAGEDPATFRREPGGATLVDLLAAEADSLESALDWERSAIALTASLQDPRGFAGHDYVAALESFHTLGQIGATGQVNDDIYGIYAFHAVGHALDSDPIQDARTTIKTAQNVDGSWSYTMAAGPGSVDLTGAAVCALVLAGESPTALAVTRAMDWLADRQNADGGFGASAQSPASNTQSTAHALHAIRCVGEDPASGRWGTAGSNPLQWLLENQQADGSWQPDYSIFATGEALQALTGASHPLVSWIPAAFTLSSSSVKRDEAVTFTDATGRDDVHRWEWAFGDGATASGREVTHAYSTLGTYTVTLTVWGDDRAKGRASGTVRVVNEPPVALAEAAPATAHRGERVTFDGSSSTDADGEVQAWRWEFGDGNVTAWSSTSVVQHAYRDPGTYDARLRVRDDDGGISAATRVRIEVLNRAPVVTLPPVVTINRSTPMMVESPATDPDGDAVELTWEFGDGSDGSALPHVFAVPGEFVVNVTARDPFDAVANGSLRVRVLNEAPRIVRVEPATTSLLEGEAVTLTANVLDPDGDDVNVTWTFPDGGSASGSTTEWTADAAGERVVRVRVADAWDGNATADVTFTVMAASEVTNTSAPAESDEPPRANESAEPRSNASAKPPEDDLTRAGSGGASPRPHAPAAEEPPRANAAPRVLFQSPRTDAVVAGLVDVTFRVDDDGVVASVDARVGGSPLPIAAEGGGWRALLDASAHPAGALTLRARATDSEGLTGAWSTLRVLVDSRAPEDDAPAVTDAGAVEEAFAAPGTHQLSVPGPGPAVWLLAVAVLTRAMARRRAA